ncbi:hypothetical protein MBLNU230_g7809t1 [Neophaeotheca triangularis]
MAVDWTADKHSFADRLSTFQHPHQLSKRRASSQTKAKKANTVEWPHQRPAPEELARAGFFYRPATDSPDNVQCFCCAVKLDGWEEEDDSLKEHLAHSKACAWALSLSVSRTPDEEPETRDPMSDEMMDARQGTFDIGKGWCHESKRGWRCKIGKMVEAGWTFDPSPEAEDGVTCFYCNLSLDGWEPKDDPLEEHKRRSPECPFYTLVEQYHGSVGKGKGKGKGKGRGSTASRASRLSAQSVASGFSDAPSAADLGEGMTSVDDSIMSTASQATAKGKKKPGRPKAAAKGAKGKKRDSTMSQDTEMDVQYPDLSMQMDGTHAMPGQWDDSVIPETEEAALPAPAKATRKATRQSKQADSSLAEVSQIEATVGKATRGRKAKAKPEPEPEPEVDERVETPMKPEQRESEVSAQLQEELDHSMELEPPDGQSTPQPEPTRPKRGVKRTSDGMRKHNDSSVMNVEEPDQSEPAAKGEKGKNVTPQPVLADESEAEAPFQNPEPLPRETTVEPQLEGDIEVAKPAKAKKAPAKKGKGKGKKTSSARSSKATVTEDEETQPFRDQPEDLEKDEQEIDAELKRIAEEQTASAARDPTPEQNEQGHEKEYEPSPTPHKQQHANRIHELEANLHDEVEHIPRPGENMTKYVATVAISPHPDRQYHELATRQPEPHSQIHHATPSPSPSDKENQPSSHPRAPSTIKPAPIVLSPSKNPSRQPLALSTPNRTSPSKTLTHLTSTAPWHPVPDTLLDNLLLTSPQPTPNRLGAQLADAAGRLSEEEAAMSVEAWVRWRAGRAEEELRRKCERLVQGFEGEGNRAVESLGEIEVIS